ncbi:hypothetical protein ACVGWI_00095, partial [Enterobacter hormaechei]
ITIISISFGGVFFFKKTKHPNLRLPPAGKRTRGEKQSNVSGGRVGGCGCRPTQNIRAKGSCGQLDVQPKIYTFC